MLRRPYVGSLEVVIHGVKRRKSDNGGAEMIKMYQYVVLHLYLSIKYTMHIN